VTSCVGMEIVHRKALIYRRRIGSSAGMAAEVIALPRFSALCQYDRRDALSAGQIVDLRCYDCAIFSKRGFANAR
jgi:hypothetical protein